MNFLFTIQCCFYFLSSTKNLLLSISTGKPLNTQNATAAYTQKCANGHIATQTLWKFVQAVTACSVNAGSEPCKKRFIDANGKLHKIINANAIMNKSHGKNPGGI